jgi:hypothetical protein
MPTSFPRNSLYILGRELCWRAGIKPARAVLAVSIMEPIMSVANLYPEVVRPLGPILGGDSNLPNNSEVRPYQLNQDS